MVAKAITDYKMIEDGDRVLIAVSGGKDSLVMLESVAAFKKYRLIDYEVEAIHINVTDVPYQIDQTYFRNLCDELKIKSHILDVEAGIEDRGKKSHCYICSFHRRKKLFIFAKENGFQKIALGHHLDDAIETLLINMVYHANISSIPGKLSMFDGILQVIRPLILLTNKDTREFAHIRHFPDLKRSCPFEDLTMRTEARNLIRQLENIHPKVRFNLFNSMGNIDENHLP